MSARTLAERGEFRAVYRAAPPAPPMDGLSPEAANAWVFMRDEGGFWTAAELGRTLLPSEAPSRAARRASRWLSALERRRHVAPNPLAIRLQSYGVTARCIPIPGMLMEPGLSLPLPSSSLA